MDPNLKITWAVFETSAKTCEGIFESMSWFIKILGE